MEPRLKVTAKATGKGKFDLPHLRNRLTDFDET